VGDFCCCAPKPGIEDHLLSRFWDLLVGSEGLVGDEVGDEVVLAVVCAVTLVVLVLLVLADEPVELGVL